MHGTAAKEGRTLQGASNMRGKLEGAVSRASLFGVWTCWRELGSVSTIYVSDSRRYYILNMIYNHHLLELST